MDKSRQKDFARRIAAANKTELVVITYDIILEEMDAARKALETEDKETYRALLKRAQRFLGELMSALDFKYAISGQLMSLYEYVQRILVKSDVSGSDAGLEGAAEVLKGLKESYSKIAQEDTSDAVMENTQSVYAGLTYGRGSLNETNLTDGTNRGFLA